MLLEDFAKLSIIPLASSSLINLVFLLPQTAQFDERIILLVFVFTTLGNLHSVVFKHNIFCAFYILSHLGLFP